jgi:putative protease
MRYDLLDENMQEVSDENGEPIHQRYLLSLQDLDRSASLAELIDAGVTTFKIEGRLKDASYVTNITAYYRQKLDELLQKPQTVQIDFEPDPQKTFHRGATDYFLHGRTRPMANWQTPKSTGEYIGEVLEIRGNMLRVRLKQGIQLHNGDGLTMGDEGFSVNGVEGNIIKINKSLAVNAIKNKRDLYRNLDVEFLRSLHAERRIPVDIEFSETEEGFTLRIGEKKRDFVYGKEPARNAEKALETIKSQISKLGDTIYSVRSVSVETKPYFIPISTLNSWRREVLEM